MGFYLGHSLELG